MKYYIYTHTYTYTSLYGLNGFKNKYIQTSQNSNQKY